MSSKKRKAALTLALCILALAASIGLAVFLTVRSEEPAEQPAASDSVAEQQPAEPTAEPVPEATPEPTPEPTPAPTPEPTPVVFPDVEQQPATVYPEGGQPVFTVAAADGLRMRSGPGTDFSRVATVPTGTQVTALGADGTDGWILVQYNGSYGWLTKQYLTAN